MVVYAHFAEFVNYENYVIYAREADFAYTRKIPQNCLRAGSCIRKC